MEDTIGPTITNGATSVVPNGANNVTIEPPEKADRRMGRERITSRLCPALRLSLRRSSPARLWGTRIACLVLYFPNASLFTT